MAKWEGGTRTASHSKALKGSAVLFGVCLQGVGNGLEGSSSTAVVRTLTSSWKAWAHALF